MNPTYEDSMMYDQMSMSSSKFSVILKSNQNGGYYEENEKIKKFKDRNR